MDIKEKILQLRSKIPERGATEEEAFAALAMADKLMEKHGITEEELNKIEFVRDMREGQFKQRQKAQHPVSKYCMIKIGQFCGVKVWWNPNFHYSRMFGLDGDVEMAEFLMGLIHDSMERGWKEFLANNPKRAIVSRHTEYWSFMMGFAERVNEKIDELIAAREVHQSSTGTDLVEVKMTLVEDAMETMLPSVKLRRSTSRGIRGDHSAYGQGQVAGNQVNLNRPLNRPGSRKMIR